MVSKIVPEGDNLCASYLVLKTLQSWKVSYAQRITDDTYVANNKTGKVDCSKLGEGYIYIDFGVELDATPGCTLIHGDGELKYVGACPA